MDFHLAKRNCSFVIYGGQEEFDAYMRVKEWVQQTQSVQHQPEFHSYSLDERMKFQAGQISQVSKFIQSQGGLQKNLKMLPGLYSILGQEVQRPLQISAWFNQIVKQYFKSDAAKKILGEVDSLQAFGAVLLDENDFPNQRVNRYSLDELKTTINKDGVSTNTQGGKTGLYLPTHQTKYALVLAQKQLALVALKDQQNKPLPGVKLNWLGKSFELTSNWNVELKNVPVIELVELGEEWRQTVSVLEAFNHLSEAKNQLLDVLRASLLATRYGKMRRQFKTLDDDPKSERLIIEYQVVTERIVSAITFAFTSLVGLEQIKAKFEASLKSRQTDAFSYSLFIRLYAQNAIQKGYEHIEVVRETMGGFGFLRFSGLPTIQERAIWLYQQHGQLQDHYAQELLRRLKNPQENQSFVNGVSGMVSATHPKQMLEEVGQVDELSALNPFSLFGYLAAKLRQKFLDAPEKIHTQQTVNLTIESLTTFTGIQFFYYLAFRRHRVANEVLDKVFLHFIQTELLHHEPDDKKRHLIQKTLTKVQSDVLKHIDILVEALEMKDTFYDALVAHDDQTKFYTNLIDWAKNRNLRNDPKVKEFITQDLSQYLQRPRL